MTRELWVGYKKLYLGLYNLEEDAAKAYDKAALRLLDLGKFVPNFEIKL